MDTRIKNNWYDNLTSGEYKQCRTGTLKDADETYCCLGVLQDMYRLETGDGEWIEQYDGTYCYVYSDDQSAYTFPAQRVVKWAGLKNENPEVMLSHMSRRLASLNDHEMNFKEIAELIKEQL